jgi:hypothetical protein
MLAALHAERCRLVAALGDVDARIVACRQVRVICPQGLPAHSVLPVVGRPGQCLRVKETKRLRGGGM